MHQKLSDELLRRGLPKIVLNLFPVKSLESIIKYKLYWKWLHSKNSPLFYHKRKLNIDQLLSFDDPPKSIFIDMEIFHFLSILSWLGGEQRVWVVVVY